MRNKFIIVSALLTLTILIGGVLLLTKKGNSQSYSLSTPTAYEYYWSPTCPHCAKVNDFISTWEGKDKVQITKYEVSASRENTIRFIDRGSYCNFPKKELGVPFLVTPDGLCISGDQPIIDHLKGLKLE